MVSLSRTQRIRSYSCVSSGCMCVCVCVLVLQENGSVAAGTGGGTEFDSAAAVGQRTADGASECRCSHRRRAAAHRCLRDHLSGTFLFLLCLLVVWLHVLWLGACVHVCACGSEWEGADEGYMDMSRKCRGRRWHGSHRPPKPHPPRQLPRRHWVLSK